MAKNASATKGDDLLGEADREFLRGVAERTVRDNARERAELGIRLEAARGEARRLAALLAGMPEVRRVLLFGSTATGRCYRRDSDIDLAIEGGDLLACMAVVEGSSFAVDLVEIERLPEGIRSRAREEGLLLYEKT
ncbi:MAG: nucleotidyltransferase domain-containing protein [Spirochaetaceae bacterium]|nr:nucleotidyltransferase domain-containing protein [Spirochaetaceae bacterium]